MASTRLRSSSMLRRLLFALVAIGLKLRVGAECEAMAATPLIPAVEQPHCADMPMKSGKPDKPAAACVLCAALPDAAAPSDTAPVVRHLDFVSAICTQLVGLAGKPAPPPPRTA